MSEQPLISVVIPVHNARSTLGLAVASLQQQTWQHWEAVFVDDGSNDGSPEIIEAWDDDRMRLIRQAQAGAASARNTGLRHANGELIAFLDADDLLFPRYLQRSVELLEADGGKSIVTNNAFYLYPDGIRAKGLRHRYALPRGLKRQQSAILSSNFASIGSVFPRALVGDIGEFDTALDRAEDWDFWMRASFAGWYFILQRQPLALYNRSQVSLTSAAELVAVAEAAILAKALRTLPLSQEQVRRVVHRLATGEPSVLYSEAASLVGEGKYAAAARKHWLATQMTSSPWQGKVRAAAFRAAPSVVGRLLRMSGRYG